MVSKEYFPWSLNALIYQVDEDFPEYHKAESVIDIGIVYK